MRQLTIKLIDEAIFNEFEVTISLDDLRYLDGTFVLTPELAFQTSIVMLESTNLHSDAIGATIEVKASLGISFADFAKLIINKSLRLPFKKAVYDVKTSILYMSDDLELLTEDKIYNTLTDAGNYSFEFTLS